MSNLEGAPDIDEQIQRIRLEIEKKRAEKNMRVNGNNLGNIGIQRDTTSNVFTTLESDLGELRTQDGNSVRQRQSFDGRFDNEINRKELIENKSIIQEYQSNTTGNQFIEYKYIGESTVKDAATKKQGLKWRNESGEVILWNGTYTIQKKFGYTHYRIAVQKGKIENGRMKYNQNYTFIDILADDTGMPVISK